MPEDRTDLKRRIKALLQKHTGPENAIRMGNVFVAITGQHLIPYKRHEQTRFIRSIVQELRRDGCPIAIDKRGYYWARDEAELQNTVAKLHKSAMTNLQTEAALKRIPFGDLLKQYEIEFQQEGDDNAA